MSALELTLSELASRLPERLGRAITAVDSHTAGESTRVLFGGMPRPDGLASMADVRRWLGSEHDDVRRFVTREPRGHRDLVGAWVTEPCDPSADFGVVFMDAQRYPFACGTATVGAVTTLVELGLVTPREGEVVVDTPAGPVVARVAVEEGRARAVTLTMMPSFVQAESVPLALDDGRRVDATVVFIGGYLALVDAAQLGLTIDPCHAPDIAAAGDAIVAAANAQHTVHAPSGRERTTVDGAVLYDPSGDAERRGFGTVVYGASHVDRSPCGTGTTAKMTRLHHLGRLAIGETYASRGILGTTFEGRLVRETTAGDWPAVQGEISASAHIVGVHELRLDGDADPFPDGFLLG